MNKKTTTKSTNNKENTNKKENKTKKWLDNWVNDKSKEEKKMKKRNTFDEKMDKAIDELLQNIKKIDKKYNLSKKESLKNLLDQYNYKPNSVLYSYENFSLLKQDSLIMGFRCKNNDTKEYQKEIDAKINDLISYCRDKQFKGLKFDIMVKF